MKILIVDDSALMRSILRQRLEEVPEFTITDETSNGRKAVELNRTLEPDLIIMDIDMPVLNGIEATKKIMQERPVPILIFSHSIDAEMSFRALSAGATEVMQKPELDRFNENTYFTEFCNKISTIGTCNMNAERIISKEKTRQKFAGIVIGASTGGPVAVRSILKGLPADFPLGIAVVQHIDDNFDKSYAKWLDSEVALSVRLAKDGEYLTPGVVQIAPAGKHMVFRNKQLRLEDGEKILNQRPSVDALFKTASESFSDRLLAILLTGMGRDGAEGCVDVRKRGGYTICQDESTSAIFGMPKVAIELEAASAIMPLDKILEFLLKYAENNKHTA